MLSSADKYIESHILQKFKSYSCFFNFSLYDIDLQRWSCIVTGCCLSAMFEDVASASLLIVPVDVITYTFSGMFLGLE